MVLGEAGRESGKKGPGIPFDEGGRSGGGRDQTRPFRRIAVTTQVDRLKVPRNAGLGKSTF